MQRRLFFILILLAASSFRVTAGCINPFTLAHSTVGVTRYFDDNEKKEARPGVLGIRGTAWFLSPLSMVTVKHAAAAMHLSDQNWKQVEIRNGLNKQLIAARIQHFAGTHAEKIAVLELCQGSARRGRQKVAILFGRFAKEIKGRVEKVANGQRRIKEGRASRRPGAGHTQQAAQGGAGACEARCGRARS